MLDADSAFDLDPGWLSEDPFYLDSLEDDPRRSSMPTASRWRESSTRRGTGSAPNCQLAVPTLAVHGADHPIAPVDAVRAYAES